MHCSCTHVTADAVISSAIIGQEGGAAAAGGGAPGHESDLDMALRMSMESLQQDEQRRRGDQPAAVPAPVAQRMDVEPVYDEDEELRRAIELSLAEGAAAEQMVTEAAPLAQPAPSPHLQTPTTTTQAQAQPGQLPAGVTPDMLSAALASLPGVDVNSQQIQACQTSSC